MSYNHTTRIEITNIVAKSQLVPPFSLSSLSVAFPFSHRSILPRIFFPFQHMYLSIFRTGTVISRSSHSVSDVESSFRWLRSILAPFYLELSDHYSILNIVAFVNLAPPLELSNLATNLPNCSYDPSPIFSDEDGHEHLVDCITFYFHEGRPHYTALIFPTGKVTFTGFKSVAELEAHALKFSSILSEIALKHPEVLSK